MPAKYPGFTRHTADGSSVNLTNFHSLNSCPHYWAESHCISLALKEWLVRYLSIVYRGAVQGITGSCHQLQMDDEHTRFIDCLLFQGAEVSLEGRAGASRSVIDFSPYMPYEQRFSLIDTQQLNACIRLQRADHILGSSHVEVDLWHPEADDEKRIVLSGALGTLHAPIVPTPEALYKADFLVIESTYGDRLREDRCSRRARPEKVRELYPRCINHWPFAILKADRRRARLATVNRLTLSAQPAIVTAGNGMRSSGRIVNYLKAMLGNVRHGVFSFGYLPLGRKLQRSGYMEFDVQRYDIRAQLHTIDNYSAHADRSGVVSFVTRRAHCRMKFVWCMVAS